MSGTIARAEEIMQQESTQTEPGRQPAHKEPTSPNYARCWATWRRIRESGDPKGAPAAAKNSEKNEGEKNEEVSTPHDTAAMAVAAGAGKGSRGNSGPRFRWVRYREHR